MRKLNILLLGAAGALAIGGVANAGLDGLYGNTLVATYPDGSTVKAHLKADGTYDIVKPDGTSDTGTYKDADGKTCFTSAASPANPVCGPTLDGKKVGDAWDIPGPDGKPIKASVVAGA